MSLLMHTFGCLINRKTDSTILSVILAFTLRASPELKAQPDTAWSKNYDIMYSCYEVLLTNEGNFVLGGSKYFNYDNRRTDFQALMVNSSGNLIWEVVMMDTGMASFISSVMCDENQIYLIGNGTNNVGGPGYVACVSFDGDSLWRSSFGGRNAQFRSSLRVNNGGVVCAGSTYELTENGGADGYLLNVDADGNERWHRMFGGRGNDYFNDMIRTSDGGFALTGETRSFGGGSQFYLVKTDSTGEEEWSGAYGFDNRPDVADAVGQLPDGGFVMAGWTYPRQGTETDMLVIRVNAEGEELWRRTFGDSINVEYFHDLVVLPDGDIVILGNSSVTYLVVLTRLTHNGEVIWDTRYRIGPRNMGTPNSYSLLRLEDGSYVFGGYSDGAGGFLVKTAPDTTGQNAVVLLDPAFPSRFSLSSPYPNPFNAATLITYALPQTGRIRLVASDLAGRQVEVIQDEVLTAGQHRTMWDAGHLSSGIYMIRMEAGNYRTTVKAIILR